MVPGRRLPARTRAKFIRLIEGGGGDPVGGLGGVALGGLHAVEGHAEFVEGGDDRGAGLVMSAEEARAAETTNSSGRLDFGAVG